MLPLKEVYQASLEASNAAHAELAITKCYEAAYTAASGAKTTAWYTLPSDCPSGARSLIIARLANDYGITAVIENDRDNRFIPTVRMSGWAA